jgi:hypothetical protein
MMVPARDPSSRRGVALVIGMVILIVMTLVILSSVTLSTGNLKAVSNMQFRDAALAASTLAIEEVVSTAFMNAPADARIAVDIDRDGTSDYTVYVPVPTCTRWTIPNPVDLDPSEPADQPCFSGSRIDGLGADALSTFCADTLWELRAYQVVGAGTVPAADPVTGAGVTVNQGIRVRMSRALAKNACD